ncbi:hypothetical protein [Spirosoma panaciterrae]|uniref:hypothetical protein n=1 Tax=Spirosoma panaciterrae TaxID=496058 RepID=UPI00036ED478|nr:hypothetical protein [Spirosoma panaciterrae]
MATQTERAVVDLVINGQSAKTTLKEVSLEVTKTRSALNKMKETDPGYKDRLKEMHALIDAQRTMTARINDTSTAWGRFKKEAATVMTGVVGGNIATAGLQALVGLIPDTVQKTLKLKDAFADIEKATGLSTAGVEKLNKELKAIDTRTTNQELRDIAVAGGQLGVANDQLLGFVENVDKAVVALGDEFTGGVDQVAKEIGGIAKLFDETKTMQIGPAINNIGSALNELGAAGSATSPVVAEFTTRMGQLGDLAPKLSETLGLGAALQELGLSAEIGASGLSGLLLTAANNSDLFAQHLGMSKKAVEDLINTSPNDFLMTLAKSFSGLAPVQVAQRLKELKVESQESIKVMSLLADQTDFVAQKQALAAKAMQEGTSLTDEFSKKNHQLARDLKDLNEWFNSLFSSKALQEFLVSATHNTVEFLKALPQLGQWLSKNSEYVYILVAATAAYYGAIIKATVAAWANTTAEIARRVAYQAGYRWLLISEVATKAYALATGVLTGQISLQTAAVTLARGAWSALSAVFLANPIGLVIAGITALGYAVKLYSDNTKEALRLEQLRQRLQFDMRLLTELQTRSLEKYNEQMQNYAGLSQQQRAELVKNVAVGKLEMESRLARMQVRQKEMEMLALEPSLWEKLWAVIKSGGNLAAVPTGILQAGLQQMQAVRAQFEQQVAPIKANIQQMQGILNQVSQFEQGSVKPTGTGTLNTLTDPEKKNKKAQQAAEDLEKMLAESRQRIMAGEESDYEREVAAFAAKYSKMYELAKDNQAKIDEIRRLSLLEFEQIDNKRLEKEDEERRKRQQKENKEGFHASLNLAEQTRTDGQAPIDQGVVTHKLGENEAQMMELQADQAFLEQKLVLEQTFAQESAETQRQLTENWNAQLKLRAQTEYQAAEQMKQVEWALMDAKRAAYAEGISVLKGFLKEGSLAYKAAIIAQKAFAIAQIIIDTQREIAGLPANPSVLALPIGVREAYIAKSALSAKIRAGIAIATIAGAGIQEVAAKAQGGFTSVRELYGSPSGFVDSPTLFNLGRRSYIAGEAGREFVISNRALQNPVIADFARLTDVAQKTGNYSVMDSATGYNQALGPGSGTKEGALGDNMVVVAAIGRLEQRIADLASRKISFDILAFERKQNEMQSIREENKL